jgi:hypothetical protein
MSPSGQEDVTVAEPGTRTPQAPEEDCWVEICPMQYCGANAGQPCMTRQGLFALRTHRNRFTAHSKPLDKERGPGSWNSRPPNEARTRDDFQEHPELDKFFEDVSEFMIWDESTEDYRNKDNL